MVSHCANPNCQKPLHYLREGKVFLFSGRNISKRQSTLNRLEHFWLCGVCSREWTLTIDEENKVQLLAKKRRRARVKYSAALPEPAL